jgi:hypothetical protein
MEETPKGGRGPPWAVAPLERQRDPDTGINHISVSDHDTGINHVSVSDPDTAINHITVSQALTQVSTTLQCLGP